MESYTDDEGSRIYESWIDGLTDGTSGSVVGYMEAPFAERTIVHGGRQSLPLEYNNAESPFFSEAGRQFSPAQNWTLHGADALSLWVRGAAAASAGGAVQPTDLYVDRPGQHRQDGYGHQPDGGHPRPSGPSGKIP